MYEFLFWKYLDRYKCFSPLVYSCSKNFNGNPYFELQKTFSGIFLNVYLLDFLIFFSNTISFDNIVT